MLFDHRFNFETGPGWLSWEKMQLSGWDERSINNTFAMHYNGRNKPWYAYLVSLRYFS
jgi:hypothetical protein